MDWNWVIGILDEVGLRFVWTTNVSRSYGVLKRKSEVRSAKLINMIAVIGS